MLEDRFSGLVVWYRRWRLRRTYSQVVARRDGADGPLSNYIATLYELEREGLIDLEDGEVTWQWP